MRKIAVIIEIEDNNFTENKLHQGLDGLLGRSMLSYEVLKDTSELYESDANFRKICKAVKLAKKAQSDYIYKQQLKPKQ